MQIRERKSIDTLYSEVKEYDIVFTVDAPLAEGLNGRIDSPRLGRFVSTPHRFVRSGQQNTEILEKRDLFLAIVQEADVSWKQAMYFLDEIVDAWKHTGSLDRVEEYERFSTDTARSIIEIIRSTDNVFSRMEQYQLPDDLKVAVVGEHQFNALDRQVLPEQYDRIPVFTDDTQEMDAFKLFDSSSAIVQAVVGTVSTANADDVAVIVDPESAYPTLIESRLAAAGIPYMTDRTLAENQGMRALLSLLQAALDRDRIRVGEIRPLLPSVDISIPMKYDDKRLNAIDHGNVTDLQRLLERVSGGSIGDAVGLLDQQSEVDSSTLQEVLEDLQLWEADVTQENLQRLEYYLSAFNDQTDRSRRGVLLASAKSSAYVDRPIVFYLGMDAGWTHNRRRRPWIEREQVETQRLQDFELLLQNGEQQHYLVQDREMNADVTPCFYFNELFDEQIETFRDLAAADTRYGVRKKEEADAFEREAYDVAVEEERTISQSRLNRLVRCPREYFFDQLVQSVDKSYMTRGSLFHDFAEFYVNYPSYVQNHFDDCIDLMVEEMRPFLDTVALQRTEFRIGCRTIMAFLDREDVQEVSLDTYEKARWGNTFADTWDMELESSVTEMWFDDTELGCRGIVDLLADETHLVDHKSGKNAPSQQKIVRQGHVSLFEDDPTFQAIMYLTHHRRVVPDRELQFTFFHFLDNMGDVVSGEGSLDDTTASVTYHPRTFAEFIATEEGFEAVIGDVAESNKRRKTLERMGYEAYRTVIEENKLPDCFDKDTALETAFAASFEQAAINAVGDYTYVAEGAEKAVKQLVDIRTTRFFREDLDEFEEFLQEQIRNLNAYKHDGFPVNDANLDVVDHRDLIRR